MVRDKLPQVSEETRALIQEEFLGNAKTNDYVLNIINRLQGENPQLLDFMSKYALSPGNGPLAHMTGMVLLYRLLEAQVAIDSAKV